MLAKQPEQNCLHVMRVFLKELSQQKDSRDQFWLQSDDQRLQAFWVAGNSYQQSRSRKFLTLGSCGTRFLREPALPQRTGWHDLHYEECRTERQGNPLAVLCFRDYWNHDLVLSRWRNKPVFFFMIPASSNTSPVRKEGGVVLGYQSVLSGAEIRCVFDEASTQLVKLNSKSRNGDSRVYSVQRPTSTDFSYVRDKIQWIMYCTVLNEQ